MATFSVSASELKYASGSSWSSGKARQGVYSTTRYEGAIRFSGIANYDFSNMEISQIKMKVTFARAGGSSNKYLTFYKAAKNAISGSISSMRGASIGSVYDRNVHGVKLVVNLFNFLGSHSAKAPYGNLCFQILR